MRCYCRPRTQLLRSLLHNNALNVTEGNEVPVYNQFCTISWAEQWNGARVNVRLSFTLPFSWKDGHADAVEIIVKVTDIPVDVEAMALRLGLQSSRRMYCLQFCHSTLCYTSPAESVPKQKGHQVNEALLPVAVSHRLKKHQASWCSIGVWGAQKKQFTLSAGDAMITMIRK